MGHPESLTRRPRRPGRGQRLAICGDYSAKTFFTAAGGADGTLMADVVYAPPLPLSAHRAGNERSGHAQVWKEKAGVMQDYQISSGTVSTGITLNDGDTMEVQADGEVISTTAFGGPNWATINVENGGLANDTVLTGAVSVEFVEPGGADTNATVNNGGGLEIEGNASKGPGTGTGATINSGGQLLVDGLALPTPPRSTRAATKPSRPPVPTTTQRSAAAGNSFRAAMRPVSPTPRRSSAAGFSR